MNKLLQKFARQVGFGSDENGEIYTSALEHLPITEDLDAFAELIVRECINVLDPNGEYTATYSHQPQPGELRKVLTQTEYGQFQAAALLKLHFGVE